MRARVDESRELSTAIAANESVVVLAKPQIEGAGAEGEFIDCVASASVAATSPSRSSPTRLSPTGCFPGSNPAPCRRVPKDSSQCWRSPAVSEQVASTGVRYIVWLDGGTRKTDGGGSLACGAAPGAAGCIGFGWWEKEAAYEATVWDLKQAKSAGSVGTSVTGTSAVIGLILPLPFVARVQGAACDRLGEQLRSFLAGTAPGAGG